MTAQQIVDLRLGDTVKAAFERPFTGEIIAIDGLLIRLACITGKPVYLWFDVRDERLSFVAHIKVDI